MRISGALVLVFSLPVLAAEGNLLAGRAPTQVTGINDPERMTDGVAALEGDEWRSTRTSVIAVGGSATWDLGEAKPLRAGMLQGDNNDDYLLEASADGTTWTALWRVHTVGEPGLRLRTIKTLDATARYIRLTARGGDGSFSVSELELHSSADTLAETGLKRKRGRADEKPAFLLWAATLGAIAFLVNSKQKMLWIAGSPFLAALLWASITAILDNFVG